MRGLTNSKLEDLGSELEFYPGLPEFLELGNLPELDEFKEYDFKVEHYIISTGITRMIKEVKLHPM